MADTWKCSKREFKDYWINTLSSDVNLQIADGLIPGLYLRYSRRTSQISFFLGCTPKTIGKRVNLFMGKLTDYDSVATIREKAKAWRNLILCGQNPIDNQLAETRKQLVEESKRFKCAELFPQYMDKYATMYKKPRTQTTNWAQYRLYLSPIFGNKYMHEIEEQHVLDAYASWVKKTSFSTANKALSLMSNFWNWCETYKYVPRKSNPCICVKKGSNPKFVPQILDAAGYKALFASLDRGPKHSKGHARSFNAIRVLALTGCRCSEIKDLLISDVALNEKRLHLHDSKTGARDVMLCDAVIPILKKAVAEARVLGSKYVFPSPTNKHKSINDIHRAFQWALSDAKLPHMRIHDLRHSYITLGANTGQNMMAMRDAAGHSRLSTTEGYSHLSDSETFTAVNNIAAKIFE